MSQNNELPPLPEPDWHDCKPMDAAHRPFYTADHMKAYARAALAAQAGQHQANWYCIEKLGMATLCANKADAIKTAKEAQEIWPQTGPYRAVQLFEHPPAQAGQSEPVAQVVMVSALGGDKGKVIRATPDKWILKAAEGTKPYTHPAPVRQPISDFDAVDSFMTEPHRLRGSGVLWFVKQSPPSIANKSKGVTTAENLMPRKMPQTNVPQPSDKVATHDSPTMWPKR